MDNIMFTFATMSLYIQLITVFVIQDLYSKVCSFKPSNRSNRERRVHRPATAFKRYKDYTYSYCSSKPFVFLFNAQLSIFATTLVSSHV